MASSSFSSSPPSLLPSEPEPWRASTSLPLPPGHLLNIPDDLLYDIFTIYLRIEDVCRLDSALCQKKPRRYFLHLLATKFLLFNREEINILTDFNYEHRLAHRPLCVAALEWILKRGIHLASLCLPRCYLTTEEPRIHDAVNSLALNGRCDKLESISLSDCSHINEDDLATIISKCFQSVKNIDVRGGGLRVSSAADIKRCTKLEAFSPKGNESPAEIVEIVETCLKLRKLDFFGFRGRLTDGVLQSVAAHVSQLEHLCLLHCSSVTDLAIVRVAESCPSLKYINLVGTSITDESVVSLCRYCPCLKQIHFGGCRGLTNVAMIAVAERLPFINLVCFSGIPAITNKAAELLASKCHELEYINLSGCPSIDIGTLMMIAEHCKQLKELRISGCPGVTAAGLSEIAANCSKLSTVSFKYKRNGDARDELMERFPHIRWQ
jgi:hypothetical protein